MRKGQTVWHVSIDLPDPKIIELVCTKGTHPQTYTYNGAKFPTPRTTNLFETREAAEESVARRRAYAADCFQGDLTRRLTYTRDVLHREHANYLELAAKIRALGAEPAPWPWPLPEESR